MFKPWKQALGVVAAVVVACFLSGCVERRFDASSYYSVALTNNNLFFGHIIREDGQYLYLQDVHYIQVTRPEQDPNKKEVVPPNIKLVAQVTDFQGPRDEMNLNKKQVLYYQKLRDDSPVVKAIAKEKATPKAPESKPAQ
ncbi:MAG: hypothetical protein HYS22_01745 [Deltaproteobacteria bacterium]|nr:hypothetical protein [Deltaproteobacteria bacterium]